MLPQFLNKQRSLIFARLILNGFLQMGVMVTLAFLIREIFDHWIASGTHPDKSTFSLPWIGIGFLLSTFTAALLRYQERVDAESLGQSYVHDVRMRLFKHMTRMNQREFQNLSRGGLMLRFVGDLSGLRQWLSLGLARLSVSGIVILGTLSALAMANWQLASCVGLVLITGCIISVLLGKPLQQAVRDARRRRSYLAGNINEKLSAMAVVQVFGQAKREIDRLGRQGERLQDAMIERARVIGMLRAGMVATTAAATATTLLVGAWLIEHDSASAGSVAAAISIVGMLSSPLMDLGRVYEYWHSFRIAKEKISNILNKKITPSAPPESLQDDQLANEAGAKSATSVGGIEFRKIKLGDSLPEFSAQVSPGKFISIVGPNGAGKSTLLGLVARLVQADTGSVLIDGVDTSKLSQTQLSDLVGIVSPDLPLLKGSLRKNLKYRQPKARDIDIVELMNTCGLSEMLPDFLEGKKIPIAERGSNLSLGQRHRLALARAVLGSPAILLLDEVEANLDVDAIKMIRELLAKRQSTVLMVTHRAEMAALSDEIWYIEDGRLVESGPTQKMIRGDGPIAKFFDHHNKISIAS